MIAKAVQTRGQAASATNEIKKWEIIDERAAVATTSFAALCKRDLVAVRSLSPAASITQMAFCSGEKHWTPSKNFIVRFSTDLINKEKVLSAPNWPNTFQ